MNAAHQLAARLQLQQQLNQYGDGNQRGGLQQQQQNQQGQNLMMNNAMGNNAGGNNGMGGLQQQQQQQLQQAYLQQHQQQLQLQQQNSQGGNMTGLQDINNMQRRNPQQQQLQAMMQQQQLQAARSNSQLSGSANNLSGTGASTGGMGAFGGVGGQNANWGNSQLGGQQQQQQGRQQNSLDLSNNPNQMGGLGGMNNNLGGSMNSSSNSNSNSNNSNMNAQQQLQQQHNNALLGQRSTSQGNNQQQGFNSTSNNNSNMGIGGLGGIGGMGMNNMGGGQADTSALQQQIAFLQRQLQQQQQRQQQQSNPMQGGSNNNTNSSGMNTSVGRQTSQTSTGNFQNQQGNQNNNNSLFSMQGMDGGMSNNSQRSNPNSGNMGLGGNNNNAVNNDPFSMMMGGGQNQNKQNQQNLLGSSMSNNLNENDLLRQPRLMNQGNNNMNNNNNNNNNNMMGLQPDIMRRRASDLSMSNNSNNNSNSLDGSTRSNSGSNNKSKNDIPSGGTDYLGGSFAGGWQSNADLPDRRRVIYSILEVIRMMRPDTNQISQKLPHMAKSLEENLYRTALTKEEYMDQSTLRDRLQNIAKELESHQSNNMSSMQNKLHPNDSQQLQQLLGGNNNNNNNNNSGMNAFDNGNNNMLGGNANNNNSNSMRDRRRSAQQQIDMIAQQNLMNQQNNVSGNNGMGGSMNHSLNVAGGNGDPQKVIRQQQQRLLLLRHASKCKLGPECTTKFCAQMKPLWQHMKKCRDRDCQTRHCQSSRCVLTHYRLCKAQGKTATCEICGPVMEHIRRQEAAEGLDSSDPLAERDGETNAPQQQDVRSMSVFGQEDVQQNAAIAQQQLLRQQQQQQQQQQNQQNALGNSPVLLQQLQQMQMKFQQQQLVINKLKNQQAQLIEQQKQLQMQPQQGQTGQNAQNQLRLLQQLQMRAESQQRIEYNELMLQHKQIQQMQLKIQAAQQQNQNAVQIGGMVGQQNQLAQQLGANNNMNMNNMNSMNNINNMNNINKMNNSNLMNQSNSQQQLSTSQRSHHSNTSTGSQHSNRQQQRQQQQQRISDMQALSQSHKTAMNDVSPNKNKDDDQLVGNLLDENSSKLQLDLDASLEVDDNPLDLPEDLEETLEQPLEDTPKKDSETNDDKGLGEQHSSLNEPPSKKRDLSSDKTTTSALDDSSDRSSGSKAKKRKTTSGIDKGRRGRGGGKGKRLREIQKINLNNESENGSAGSVSGIKRSSDEMNKSKNDASPDTASSGAAKKGGGQPSLPKGDVEQHLLMLNKGLHLTSRTITHKCLPIVQQLIDDPYGWVFRDAVDPVLFGLPDYFEVVKNPMHLLLVKKKLENAVYTDMASFERDVKLVFENAILYNGEESDVGTLAKTMKGVFETEYKKVCEERNNLVSIDRKACVLCGLTNLKFEPPVLFCSGMSCGMARIMRNSVYYTDSKNRNFWCQRCYSKLPASRLIILDDGAEIKKSTLIFAKNDFTPEEDFLECHDCNCKVHKICALHNCRIRKPNDVFRCPKCIIVHKEIHGLASNGPKSAKDLPTCSMSDFIEKGLLESLENSYRKTALKDGIPISSVKKAEGLSVRVMSHVYLKQIVRDEMSKTYSKDGYPHDFPVHTKCIGLFQSIHGVDILLFAMYVYEYGHECPAPNRRRVYISYLDSVQYFEPKRYRSTAYQTIIIEYLRFAKKRGFHTAHIWSCPPADGDEYVFHCHPSHQKVPNEEMLRKWYYNAIDKAKNEGIVVETTNFYDEYFNCKKTGISSPYREVNPMSLPYFEGDYIPGEIETILAKLNNEELPRKTRSSNNSMASEMLAKPKPRTSGSRLGTRSDPSQSAKKFHEKVMSRLGMAIYNMKENLIIVRLRNKHFALAVDQGLDVSEWPDDDAYEPNPVDLIRSSNVNNTNDYAKEYKRTSKRWSIPDTIGATVDEDAQFESEMFENRQLFLNYCQVNHCQFDEIRKAKHSTIMVLYQLHNPSAPKFVRQCGACQKDIGNENRYKCNVCADYDLCLDCYDPVRKGLWASRGSRFLHAKTHTFTLVKSNNADALSSAKAGGASISMAERAKALEAYLGVLNHAANCPGPSTGCKLKNCAKMKQLLTHVVSCPLSTGGATATSCKICARVLSLIIVHARSCTADENRICSLPYCHKIRERNRRIRRQQRCMDDRRRRAQNAVYSRGSR